MRGRKRIIITLSVILAAVIAVDAVYLFANRDEELRYPTIKSIELTEEYPPFDHYRLTNAEINQLVDALDLIDFSQYEIMEFYPTGEPDRCTITTEEETYELYFAKPYFFISGTVYSTEGHDCSAFDVVEEILEKHRST